jgi:hypothetical protein
MSATDPWQVAAQLRATCSLWASSCAAACNMQSLGK